MNTTYTPVVTIDGRTSKDLDDAFSITTLPDGMGWSLDIFIANVHDTLSQDENSDLNHLLEMAEERVQTLYAGSRSLKPMLPRRLSEDQLSLNLNKHRRALKTTMRISLEGDVKITEIAPVTMRNNARLNYGHVTKLGLITDDRVRDVLEIAIDCAEVLYRRRVSSHKTIIRHDISQGIFVDEEGNFKKSKKDEIHGQILIQEFMILTNVAMTAWATKHKLPIIYRNHTAKDISVFNSDIQEALSKLPLDEFVKKTRMLCDKAVYSSKNQGHVGLDVPAYATFTSPIRRFPDLHNQKVVNEYLNGIASDSFCEARCAKINLTIDEINSSRVEHSKAVALNSAIKLLRNAPDRLTGRQLSMLIKKGDIDTANRAMTTFLRREDVKGHIELWLSAINNSHYLGSALVDSMIGELEAKESIRKSVWACHAQKNNIAEPFSEEIIEELVFNETGRHMKIETETPKEGAGVNRKGRLLEVCQKLKLLMPTYDSVNTGEAHLPVWNTTCTLYLGTRAIKGCGKDMSKKASEHIASGIVMSDPELKALIAEHNTPKKSNSNEAANPKGAVLELCAAEKIPQPTVMATQSGSKWRVTLSFHRDQNQYTKTSEMTSKKLAERDAYQKLAEDLGIT